MDALKLKVGDYVLLKAMEPRRFGRLKEVRFQGYVEHVLFAGEDPEDYELCTAGLYPPRARCSKYPRVLLGQPPMRPGGRWRYVVVPLTPIWTWGVQGELFK